MSIFNRTKPAPAKKSATKKPAATKAVVTDAGLIPVAEAATDVTRTRLSHGIIIAPLVTEKSARLTEAHQYGFIVARRANKIQIAHAIKERYGVTPVAVNVANYDGKKVRYGRMSGVRSAWKKAIVTVPADATLNIYEGV